jgi:hypothetical protein
MPEPKPELPPPTIRETLRFALVRTVTPYVVGFLVVALVRLGIEFDDATLTNAVTVGVGSVYYAVLKVLETRYPALGVLLGRATPPIYGEQLLELEAAMPANVASPAPDVVPVVVPHPLEPPPSPAIPDVPEDDERAG